MRTPWLRHQTEASGAIARLTLARPPLNVLNIDLLADLSDAVGAVAEDPDVRVLVLDADPACRAFSAGVDVADHTDDRVDAMLETFHGVFRALGRVAVPTVAVVDGPALGGGCELVAAFDIVLASERARFGQPEITLGVFAPVASLLLPATIGPKRAADWLFTGRVVGASEALQAGLASRLCGADELNDVASDVVNGIAALSGAALKLAKRSYRVGAGPGIASEALEAVEALYRRDLLATDDAREGLAAFQERRPPIWRHR